MNFRTHFEPNWRSAFFLAAILSTVGCHASQSGLAPGRYVEHLQSGGLDRDFIVDVPKSYDSKTPMPVVLVYHGWTSTAADAEVFTGMKEEGEAQGFITVFPDGIAKAWNAGFINLTGSKPDDVQFTSDLLDHLEKELNIDKNREYACGHSNGAFMANDLGSKLSSRFAAIGSVAGTIGVKDQKISPPDSPISVILIHGKMDPMVAYGKDSKALLKGVGAEEAAEWWAQQDGCGPTPDTKTSGNGNVTTERFKEGKGDAEVELVSIANGSHDWPGAWKVVNGQRIQESSTTVNGADVLWQFFKAHPKG